MKNKRFDHVFASLALGLLTLMLAHAAPAANLARTPPMGWNSWNWFGKQAINERIVRECIDAMVDQGLRDAGYTYVVVDGGWRDTKLGPNGELRAHPAKFPHGMKSLADYAHSKGLKFGLHTVPGTCDCGGDPVGGYGHEVIQVKQFADWGLDFVKLDQCQFTGGWNKQLLQATYAKWSELLGSCERAMVLSMSAYKFYDWYPKFGQMGRTTPDILAKVSPGGAVFDHRPRSVMAVAEENNASAASAGNGYWNDPDMLVTGLQGLTQDEQQAHFALWCVMSAPLMLGNDPRAMTAAEKAIILNRDAIAIDQDPTEQGRRIKRDGEAEIWAKRLGDGRVAVVLLNRSASKIRPVALNWKDVGLSGKLSVKDVYERKELGPFSASITKPILPHACSFLLLSSTSEQPTPH